MAEARVLVEEGMSEPNTLKKAVKQFKPTFDIMQKVLLGRKYRGPPTFRSRPAGPSRV